MREAEVRGWRSEQGGIVAQGRWCERGGDTVLCGGRWHERGGDPCRHERGGGAVRGRRREQGGGITQREGRRRKQGGGATQARRMQIGSSVRAPSSPLYCAQPKIENRSCLLLKIALVALVVVFQLCRTWMQRPATQVHNLELVLHSDGAASSSSSTMQGVRDLELILHSDGRCTAAALDLLLFSNQRRHEAAHALSPESHKLSSPSLFLLFLLHDLLFSFSFSCVELLHGTAQRRHDPTTVVALQDTMAARLDGATSQGTTVARHLKRRGLLQGSDGVGAGSTKAAAARSDDSGIGFGPDGSRSRLGSFFLKLIFGAG
jgi:hypothetical protein